MKLVLRRILKRKTLKLKQNHKPLQKQFGTGSELMSMHLCGPDQKMRLPRKNTKNFTKMY